MRFLLHLFFAIITACVVACSYTLVKNVCSPADEEIPETDFRIDKYGNPISWTYASMPMAVVVSPEFDEKETEVIVKAIEYWNEQLGEDVFFLVLGLSNDIRHTRFQIRITEHKLSKRCGTQLLGLATNKLIHRREIEAVFITSSHIEIHSGHPHNSTYFRTVVHELGHALGLNHDADRSSVMYPKILDSSWHIEENDIEMLKQLMNNETYVNRNI